MGVGRRFTAAGAWLPPPTLFQTFTATPGGGYTMMYPDGMMMRFNGVGKVISQRAPTTTRSCWRTNGAGRLQTVTGAGGATFTFVHTAAGLLERVTDSAGRSVSFAYDGLGHLRTETDRKLPS